MDEFYPFNGCFEFGIAGHYSLQINGTALSQAEQSAVPAFLQTLGVRGCYQFGAQLWRRLVEVFAPIRCTNRAVGHVHMLPARARCPEGLVANVLVAQVRRLCIQPNALHVT